MLWYNHNTKSHEKGLHSMIDARWRLSLTSLVLSLAAASSTGAPSLSTCQWKGADGVYDGMVTDAVHWVDGVLPGPLSQATFNQNADYAVFVPEDGYETLASLDFAAFAGHVFSLDTRGAFLHQKTADGDNYGAQPLRIQADTKCLARLETSNFAAAQSLISNAVMTVKSATANPLEPFPSLSVSGGLFNILDPGGEMPSFMNAWRVFVNSASDSGRIVYTNCEVRLPDLVVHGGQSGDSELVFDGCPVLVAGKVKFYDSSRVDIATNTVRFKGGSRVTLDGGLYIDNVKVNEARMRKTCRLVAEGLDTIVNVNVANEYGGIWDSDLSIGVCDGAEMMFAGGQSWAFGYGIAAGSPNPKAFADLRVRNATLRFGSSDAGLPSLVMGQGYAARAGLIIEGEDAVFELYATGNQFFGYNAGDSSPMTSLGSLSVLGGTATFHEGSSYRLYLGYRPGTTGIVEVAGGRLCIEGGYGLGVHKGVGLVTVSGGELAVSRMPICSEDSTADESVVRQTGGVITVDPRTETTKSLSDMKGVQITTNNKLTRRARLVLDGGVFRANYVVGGSSAKVNGGTGSAVFEANGGILEANAAAPFLLETFDTATLGERGLTIRSDYAAVVRQPFANAGLSQGKLVLAGSGVKTLAGTSTVARIVVAGGEVSFDAEACPRSHVVVTNGALVNFNGGASGGRLTGLTLGDEHSFARLAVASGEEILVSGDLSIADVRLSLAGNFDLGTTNTIIRCSGSVSAASAEAWRTALVSSGLSGGSAGEFIVITEGGETRLSMAVREAQELILRVDEGVSNVVESITFSQGDTLRMIVGEDAVLNVSGRVARGAIVKEGDGAAWLTSDGNQTSGSVAIRSGMLAATSLAAFGWRDASSPGALLLGSGTIGLSDQVADAEFPWTVAMSADSSDDACVVKSDSDVTLRNPAFGTGCLIKRGAGRLTLDVPSGTVTFSSSAGKNIANGTVVPTTVTFPAGGCPPRENYAGLTIAEGELRLTGGASFQIAGGNTPGVTYVGIPVKGIVSEPGVVVDGVVATLSSQGSRHFHLGCGITDANSDVRRPYLVATNGATVNVTSFQTGWNSSGHVAPQVLVDGSTLNVSEYLYTLRGGTEGDTPTYRFRNRSRLHVDYNGQHSVEFLGGFATMVFDDSVLARNASNDRARIWVNGGTGRMLFRNGGVLYVDQFVQSQDNKMLTLAFDGGEWSPSVSDYVLSATYPGQLVFVAEEHGLVMAPPENATWTISSATFAAGTGEVILRGRGKVSFGEGVTERGVRFGGSGVISGCLYSPVLSVPLLDDGTVAETLCLDSVSVSGRVAVDLGHTADNPVHSLPSNLVVARISGAPPDVSGWRLVGTGIHNARGVFRIDGDNVVVDVIVGGMMIFVM